MPFASASPRLYLGLSLLAGVFLLSSCALHTRTTTVEVGQPAPDFALPDPDGTIWTLSEMVADGPAVVVFYRGYW